MTTKTKPGGSPEASVGENLCAHPFLSVVIPCRNEGAFIGGCLDPILSGDYPKDRLEIIVADGMSEDGTRNIVMDYGRLHPNVKLVDNPNRITPSGMNLGVQQSTGQVIAVVGAHAVYDHHYFSECIRNLQVFRADEVGGTARFVLREDTPMGRAIVVSSVRGGCKHILEEETLKDRSGSILFSHDASGEMSSSESAYLTKI